MEPNQINGLMAGGMFLCSGVFGLSRHFLLEPNLPPQVRAGYPRWLLHVAFATAVVMVYAGMRYICDSVSSHAANYTGLSVVIAGATCAYQGSLLYDTWTRRPSLLLEDIINALRGNRKDY